MTNVEVDPEAGRKAGRYELPFRVTEIAPIYETLSPHSLLKLEKVDCRAQNGLSGAAGHWGIRYFKDGEDGIDEIVRRLGEEPSPVTGFNELWRVDPDASLGQMIEDELAAVKRVGGAAIRLSGVDPGKIAAVKFGGSALPPDFDYKDLFGHDYGTLIAKYGYGALIAQLLGLDHLNPKTQISNHHVGCNAGGRTLRRALTEEKLRGLPVLVYALEGLTKQAPEFNLRDADHLSFQFFSDALLSTVVVPDVTMTYLVGKSAEIEDEEGVLTLVPSWQYLIDQLSDEPNQPLINRRGNTEFIRFQTPPDGRQISIQGGATTKLMLKEVSPLAKEVYDAHQAMYQDKKIRFIIFHHASYGIGKGLGRKFIEKMGMDTSMNWVVEDGNSSGVTTLLAFLRHFPWLDPGDHVMIVSFGAGVSIDAFVVKIGPREGEPIIQLDEPSDEVVVYDRLTVQAQAA